MVQINAVTRRLGGLLTGLVFWLSPVVAVQAEDDYLRLLEAEAADTGAISESGASPDNANSQNKKVRNVKADKTIEQGLTFDGFEEILSAHYSGSNFLYVKLSEKERKSVYRFYQRDNRMSSVREEIVRLLSSS
jgi:lipopolysaccharide export LptBFGC system permease protein LptF